MCERPAWLASVSHVGALTTFKRSLEAALLGRCLRLCAVELDHLANLGAHWA
jgi:hypothetical protein